MPIDPQAYSRAPKNLKQNAIYRSAYWKRAIGDKGFQQECWIRAKYDPIWYCDTFWWTYNPKEFPKAPNRAFILEDCQEEAVKKIIESIGYKDVLIEKSRTMGATWLCLFSIVHCWQFLPLQSFLVGSRNAEYVDKTGDPKSLFWKIDYALQRLPYWMRPRIDRTQRHIHNLENDSVIDGESTTGEFGTGDRRTAVMLDEFSKIEGDGDSIVRTTQHLTNTRIYNATPQGASGAYYTEWKRIKREFPTQIIRLHWSMHSLYNRGLYTTKGNIENGELVILDKDFEFPPNFQFIRDGKLRSPWYDYQCRRSPSAVFIAQELDIDFVGAGGTFFDPGKIDMLIERYCRLPTTRGELAFESDGTRVRWIDHRMHGGLMLWLTLGLDFRPPKGNYVCGIDIATGKGGDQSSNSVCTIVNRLTGEKVGQFTTNQLSPTAFARYCVAIARWFHNAYMIWEDNGPGGEFGVEVRNTGYRNVFFREDEKAFDRTKTSKAGWWSDRESKKLLLANYAHALLEGRMVNRHEAALRECLEYVYGERGDIVHSRAEASKNPLSSGENHGDMVIADALAFRGVIDIPVTEEYSQRGPPEGSFAHRQQEARSRRTKRLTKY